jgi:hypothetical protein
VLYYSLLLLLLLLLLLTSLLLLQCGGLAKLKLHPCTTKDVTMR